MRPFSHIVAIGLLPLLLAGCNRSSHEEIAASPPPQLMAGNTEAFGDASSAKKGISIKDAGNAGLMLILARDTCQVSKPDFDRMAQYFSETIGQDVQLKGAFIGGAKAAAAIHQDAINKDELPKLKRLACPGVESMLAALPAKYG